jgi:hypothetical protein
VSTIAEDLIRRINRHMIDLATQQKLNALSIKPQMSVDEIAVYAAQIKEARVVLEFGMGGSTCLAAAQSVDHLYSVETDQEWIDRCIAMPEVTPLAREGRLVTHRPDIGPTTAYSMPVDPAAARLWPTYSLSIWDRLGHTPGLVLIDGRFRLSCFLQAALRLPASTKYVIHDFWSRPHYHTVLQFVSILDRVDDLIVVQIDPRVDWRSLGIAASQTLLDPR